MLRFLERTLAPAPEDCDNAGQCSDYVLEMGKAMGDRDHDVMPPGASFGANMDNNAPVTLAQRCGGCAVSCAIRTLG